MGFGSTAKKIQKLGDVAQKTYNHIVELKEQISDLRGTVEATGERVETMERELASQRAILDALAEANEVDVEQVLADAGIDETNRQRVEVTDAGDEAATGRIDGSEADSDQGTADGPGADTSS